MGNVAACGRATEWNQHDQFAADLQADAETVRKNKVLVKTGDLVTQGQLSNLLFDQRIAVAKDQLGRDLRTMQRARANHVRARSISNGDLARDLFGLEWSGAVSMCKQMGIDPKSIITEKK